MLIQTAKEISVCMLLYTIEQSKEREERDSGREKSNEVCVGLWVGG